MRPREELRKEIEAMAGIVPQRGRKRRTMGVDHQCRHPCTVLADGLQCERCIAGSQACKREGCSSPKFFDPELGEFKYCSPQCRNENYLHDMLVNSRTVWNSQREGAQWTPLQGVPVHQPSDRVCPTL